MLSVDTNLEGVDKPLRFDFDATADTYDQWYETAEGAMYDRCLLYTSPSPRDQRGSRMPSSA